MLVARYFRKLCALCAVALVAAGWGGPASEALDARAYRCSPAQLWSSDFGAPPLLPFVADVDNDGFSDLVCLMPDGKASLAVSFNGNGVKALRTITVLDEFGESGIAAVGGCFTDRSQTQILALFADGSLRLASGFEPGRRGYTGNTAAGNLPRKMTSGASLLSGDFDGDSRDEALVVEPGGAAWLVDLAGAQAQATARTAGSLGRGIGEAAAGDLDGDGREELVFQDRTGVVWRQEVTARGLGRRMRLMAGPPGASLACAKLDDNAADEVILEDRVLWSGARRVSSWPELSGSGPGLLRAGHMRGDGREDLVRFRRTGTVREKAPPGCEPYTQHDVFVHYTYRQGDPDPANSGMTVAEKERYGLDPLKRDTSGDGLLDVWKVKGVRDLDLPKMGVQPLRKNVICEIQPLDFDEGELARLKQDIEQVRRYFDVLKIANADLSRGINFVPVLRENVPKEDSARGWRELSRKYHPREHQGITHWMAVYKGGGGQSSMMGDAGSCGNGAFYATFIHEFGHQLGLDHSGFWSSWAPTYTSLMNYSYNYSFNGSPERIHYSLGTFRRLVLDPTNLSEVIPIRKKYVEFLSRPPHSYTLKEDGANTLIDWNRNAVLGEKSVRASINSSYGLSAGVRQTVGTTLAAPFLLSHRDRDLILFSVESAAGQKAGPVVFREYLGAKRWSDPVSLSETAASGDPVAVSDDEGIWITYPAADGARLVRLSRSGHGWKPGVEELLPGSSGAQVTPAIYRGRVLLFYWSGPDSEVGARWKTDSGWGPLQSLGFKSTFPVGATVDTGKGEVVVGCGQQKGDQSTSWQVRRFTVAGDGVLAERSWEWVGGKSLVRGDFRPVLIYDRSDEASPDGRLFFLSNGTKESDGATGMWYCQQVADKSLHDGWIIRRYYDEWTRSRSTLAAAWYKGDIVMAYRWAGESSAYDDNQIHVGYSGIGIEPGLMADFDDVSLISEVGLSHSILELSVR